MAVEDVTAQALCGIMQKSLIAEGVSPAMALILAERACKPVVRAGTKKAIKGAKSAAGKAKRKVGKYQQEFGRRLKALKTKHPRTNGATLMKRAHTQTRKAMKK